MSSQPRVQPNTVEPFEDRVDFLFRELELSIKWQRPSILFGVYSSEFIHSTAEADLQAKLVKLDQKVVRISIDNKSNSDLMASLSEFASVQNAIFFVNGLRWGCTEENDLFQELNNHREFFVEKRLRIVFWLTEKEVVDLANKAPDFWAFRHRVIEFNDTPKPELIYQNATEEAWQGTGEYTEPDEDLDAKITFRETLLTSLPEGNESAVVNGNLLLTLGILHWRKGDFEKSTDYLKAALDIAVKMKDKFFAAECFNAIALVKTGMGRSDEAIEAYQRAIQLAPSQLFPWNNLGMLFARLDRNDEALKAFQKAIEYKPGDSVSWNGIGDVYMKMNKPDEAISAYMKAIEFTPNYPTAWSSLGDAYYSVNNVDNAFKAYQKSYTLNNKSVHTVLGLARVLTAQGHDNNAIQAYETALKIEPRNASAWDELGNVCLKTGAHEKAIVAYGQAVEAAPQNGLYYVHQAQVYLDMGVHLEAIALLEKSLGFIDSDEDKASTWNKLGDVFRQIGDYNRAVSAYRIADEFSGKPPQDEPEIEPEPASHNDTMMIDSTDDITASDSEVVEDISVIASSLDSKESRIEVDSDNLFKTTESISDVEENVQVVDGDHLDMLDKTIFEIEEILSRQNGMATETEIDENPVEESVQVEGENDIEEDKKDALEWNELGNTYLIAGEYDNAIFAYTRAIEMAPDFNWPYIKNLAMAYYQKGKNNLDTAGEVNSEIEENPEEESQDLGSIHELHNLSNEIFSSDFQAEEPEAPESTTTTTVPDEVYSLDGSSIVEPFSFDINTLQKELAREALQEGMEFNTGNSRDALPASREYVDAKSYVETPKFDKQEEDIPMVEINPDKGKMEMMPKNAYEWNELGNIYLKIGSNDKAIDAFKKSIELDPYFGWAYSNLALAYNHSKKFNESIPLYKKSIELIDTDKGKAISFNRMGDAYRHMDDQDNAMKAYQQASELDGNTKPILARARMVLLNNV